jgi:hypothetical protein
MSARATPVCLLSFLALAGALVAVLSFSLAPDTPAQPTGAVASHTPPQASRASVSPRCPAAST